MPMPASRPLTRAAIVAEALRAVDEHGVDALSMRSLAARLDTGPMSLYRHVADKHDLLGAVAAALLDEIPPVPEGPAWPDRLRAWAVSFRGVALRHPGAVPLLARRPMTASAAGRSAAEDGLRMLEDAGFDPDRAGLVLRSMARFVVGYSLSGSAQAAGSGAPDPGELARAGFPRLGRMLSRARADDGEELFALGLDALLAGFDARGPSAGSSVPGARGDVPVGAPADDGQRKG
jgi:AcrR family transcriptional regulator